MANTIPASQLVNVQPGVVGTGGSALSLNGVILTESDLIPTNAIVSYSTKADAIALFGAESDEAKAATVYFGGFTGANIQPGAIHFYRYVAADAGAWLRGATLNMTLAQVKALSGTLTVVVDGDTLSGGTISLSAATSFSNAAQIIQDALDSDATVEWNAVLKAFQINSGSTGVDSTIDYATGTLAESLGFTQQTGGLLSQGADASTPAETMNAIVEKTQNWATFMTMFEPDFDGKIAFAEWTKDQNLRYAYVMWDTDIQATQADSGSAGAYLLVNEYEGTIPVYGDFDLGAFVCGAAASIDFTELNGRTTFAFKGQSGLAVTVTNTTIADTLMANGYNFYGAYATATQQFNLFQNGQITGKWRWADAYLNQIYLNSQLQQAILSMLTAVKSLPYNDEGYNLLRAACQDPINQALNFGSIRTGIPLSDAQKAEIKYEAGLDITGDLYSNGYYLQILPASAQVRGNRTSPPMKLWYTDGGSIQQINLASIDVM